MKLTDYILSVFVTIGVALCILPMISCEQQKRLHETPVPSDNPTVTVTKVLTVDGITVYRFWDGRQYVYFNK